MADKNLKLRFLCLISRHGPRAPLRFLPNDPNVGHFPEGEGNLTKRGQTEMYELGCAFRKRYDHFLGDRLFGHDVYVRSTDNDRCLLSAQCCLAGLYPPLNDHDKLSPDLNWQPVSIHTMPTADDPLAFRVTDKFAQPQSTDQNEDAVNNDWMQTFRKHQDLYNYMDRMSHSKGHTVLIAMAIDAVLTEALENLVIPNELRSQLKDLEELGSVLSRLIGSDIKSLVTSANLLDDIVNRMEAFLHGPHSSSASASKTVIYVLHDINLNLLAAALCKETMHCPTASSFILEVHEDVDSTSGDLYVKILFLSKHDEDPVEMKFQIEKDSSSKVAIVGYTEFTQFARRFVKEAQDSAQLTNGYV